MRTKWYFVTPLLLLLLVGAVGPGPARPTAQAQAPQQAYTLDWWTVDGGGGHSTASGSYALDGTAGQPDAKPVLAGGNYLLNGGFWVGGAGVQPHYSIYLPAVKRNGP